MDLRPTITLLILLPIVTFNVGLSIEKQQGISFAIWGLFIAVLVWVNIAWVFAEIFKELKRKKQQE